MRVACFITATHNFKYVIAPESAIEAGTAGITVTLGTGCNRNSEPGEIFESPQEILVCDDPQNDMSVIKFRVPLGSPLNNAIPLQFDREFNANQFGIQVTMGGFDHEMYPGETQAQARSEGFANGGNAPTEPMPGIIPLPLGPFGSAKFSASIPEVQNNAQMLPGASGGPIITRIGERSKLAGINVRYAGLGRLGSTVFKTFTDTSTVDFLRSAGVNIDNVPVDAAQLHLGKMEFTISPLAGGSHVRVQLDSQSVTSSFAAGHTIHLESSPDLETWARRGVFPLVQTSEIPAGAIDVPIDKGEEFFKAVRD